MAVLTGYELALSKILKQGADLWLNNPRVSREASGTSGMTASMNGTVNLSTDDGWIPEFAKHGKIALLSLKRIMQQRVFQKSTIMIVTGSTIFWRMKSFRSSMKIRKNGDKL